MDRARQLKAAAAPFALASFEELETTLVILTRSESMRVSLSLIFA